MATELDHRESESEAVAYDDPMRDLNETSRDLASSTTEAINVDLYPVVTWFASLLTLLSVGLLGNATLLLATATSRRYGNRGRGAGSRRHVTSRYSTTLLINQSVVGLVVCLLVAPLEFATVAENYVKRPLPGIVCWAGAAGYQLAVGVLVTCFVLRAVAQCRHLRSSFSVDRRSKVSLSTDCTGRSGGGGVGVGVRRQLPERSGCSSAITWRRWMLIDAILPWLSGVVAAGLTSVEQAYIIDYRVCLDSVVYWQTDAETFDIRSSGGGGGALRWKAVLAVVYLCALISSTAALAANYFLGRKKLANILVQGGGGELSRRLLDDVTCASGENDVMDSAVKQSNAAPDNGGKNKRSASGRSQRGSSKTKSTGSKSNKKQIAEDTSQSQDTAIDQDTADPDVEDDDTFDLKMRLKFQKKSRSSGRRHTVANIGLPDLVGRLRRGSLSDTRLTAGVIGSGSNNGRRQRGASGPSGDGGSAATTPEYHYARKWSVDLIALADQLENPKAALLMTGAARAGSCQFNDLPGSLRASPSPPGGSGGSGLPLGCNRAVGVRAGRSSSPVAARPTLPRIVAENENVEQDSTLSPPDGVVVALGVDIGKGEKSDVELQKKMSCMAATAAGVVGEASVDEHGQVRTTSLVRATTARGSDCIETPPPDKKDTTIVGMTAKSVQDVDDDVTMPYDTGHVTSSADESGGGDSDFTRCRSMSSPPRDPPIAETTNEPSVHQPPTSTTAANDVAASDRLENISTLPLDPPSIVVSSLNEEDRRSFNSDDEYGSTTTPTDGVWNALRGQPSDDQCSGRDRTSHTQSADGGTSPNRTTAIDVKSVSRIRRQLDRTRRLCVMLMVSAFLAAPYAFLLVWNSGLMAAIGETWRRQVGYNLSLAAGALLCIVFAVDGPLTVWADRRLLVRLVAISADLSRLRCVCYCNIGRGRNCFYPTKAADCRRAQSRACGDSRTGLQTA